MPPAPHRYFLLSPADCSGIRAGMLRRPEAEFDLARRVRSDGAPLAEVFSFLSGLYFRGKIQYARRFARPAKTHPGVLVITAGFGLVPAETNVRLAELDAFAGVSISLKNPGYRLPLERDARALADRLSPASQVVLLGSLATGKYLEVLAPILGSRLLYPPDFLGRGDMSRGSLLLRCVREQRELSYAAARDGDFRRIGKTRGP
jgi:hypothetical protein